MHATEEIYISQLEENEEEDKNNTLRERKKLGFLFWHTPTWKAKFNFLESELLFLASVCCFFGELTFICCVKPQKQGRRAKETKNTCTETMCSSKRKPSLLKVGKVKYCLTSSCES